MGCDNFPPSTRPFGIAIPCTVPLTLYSDHAEPWDTLNRNSRPEALCWRTNQVSPDNSFEWDDLCLLHKHRPSVQLCFILLDLFWHFIDICGDEMVRDYVPQFVKPEERDLRQEFSFIWDTLCQEMATRGGSISEYLVYNDSYNSRYAHFAE